MANLKLDFIVAPTYNKLYLGVKDTSTYVTEIPSVLEPTITITPPGFDPVALPFMFNVVNIFNSIDLNITELENQPLPDGEYYIEYSINDGLTSTTISKSIFRVEQLQEKFDEAFMTLDLMECDGEIKKQSRVELMTIYFFIQGAISAANNCVSVKANELYNKANRLLDSFLSTDCGCSGNNYITTYF